MKKYVSPEIEITKAEAMDVMNGSAAEVDVIIDVAELFGQ